ncbi:hypothetical protein JZ751_020889 [Albula glossodonta]|uniref:Uncharacterized protein n=1 Tax=Albula glossodonta TaxID=121402 RepID=A0A8T2PIY9_9TELE|nr:hypothetical protein JZ751_020889 [Albula glossodonta]
MTGNYIEEIREPLNVFDSPALRRDTPPNMPADTGGEGQDGSRGKFPLGCSAKVRRMWLLCLPTGPSQTRDSSPRRRGALCFSEVHAGGGHSASLRSTPEGGTLPLQFSHSPSHNCTLANRHKINQPKSNINQRTVPLALPSQDEQSAPWDRGWWSVAEQGESRLYGPDEGDGGDRDGVMRVMETG